MVTSKNRIRAALAHLFGGGEIDRAQIKQAQTAELLALHREQPTHPARGLTPSRLAQIMDEAEAGDLVAQSDLFEDVEEKDGHVAAEMGKRRRALLALEWQVVPPDNPTPAEERAAETIGQLLDSVDDFEGVLFDVTDAIGKGFVALEYDGWRRVDGDWLPGDIIHRPQRWFQIHRDFRQELRLRGPGGGIPLTPAGWLVHVHRAKSGYLERAALFRSIAYPYLFKNYSIGDLAEFLEHYGQYAKIGRYPGGATDAEKRTLLSALIGLGRRAAGIIPQGMELELLKAVEGDPAAFKLMIQWAEETQSKVILGGILTSGTGSGTNTNALGNVHNEVRIDLRNSDARQIARSLSYQLLYPMGVLNGLVQDFRRCPRIEFDIAEREDLALFADALPKLIDRGVRVPRQWAQERLGIPEPEQGEEVLGGPAPALPFRAQQRGRIALRASPAVPDAALARIDADLQPITGDWIGAIAALVDQAGSLEELRDGLEQLLPGMTTDAYAQAMGEALAAASLAGRSDLLDEAARGG